MISELLSYRSKKLHEQDITHNIVLNKLNQPPIIALPHNAPIKDALDIFVLHQIHNIPLFEINPTTKQKNYIGALTLFDVLGYLYLEKWFDQICEYVKRQQPQLETAAPEQSYWKFENDLTVQSVVEFWDKPLNEIIGLSEESKNLRILKITEPVSTLMELFTTGRSHFVLLTGESQEDNLTLLTPLDMLSYIHDNDESSMTRLRSITAGEAVMQVRKHIGVGDYVPKVQHIKIDVKDAEKLKKLKTDLEHVKEHESDLIVVDTSTCALEAFRIMWLKKVSCVGVLNEQGKLVANLSASDIRLIASKPRNERLKPSAILYLLRPIEEYLRQDTDLTDLRPFRVSKSLDMSKVYKIMLDAYVSRVWVVDENDKPVGVITRRDLLDLVSLSKGTRKEE
ncbi:hypothetical protein BKA69DRAFT_1036130 [Paraphysoderma sedebokerense]|nr:hypothetical protein BKA69DRAFT_1036130 [Paraphysoderma sedebokerense]